MSQALLNSLDSSLRTRAAQVIPGGLWGHLDAAKLPDGYPQYYARAEGCHLHDVDGRVFVDLMCSWGPIILGHRHPAVETAVREQAALGDCMNGPAPVLVDLAELLVSLVPHADWCLFGKNGTDATTTCVTVARAGTGRRKVLLARGAYHGAVPWCSPSVAGVTAEDRAHLLYFTYNDIASLEQAVEEAGADLAAVMVSAFRHDMGLAQELPTPGFARRVRDLCDETGAAMILDDVRAGFRLHLGGSWETPGHPAGPRGLEQGDRQRPRPRRGHRPRAVPRGRRQRVHHRLVLVRLRPDGGRRRHPYRAAPPGRPGRHGPHGPTPARRPGGTRPPPRRRHPPDRPGADAEPAVRGRPGLEARLRLLRRSAAPRRLPAS